MVVPSRSPVAGFTVIRTPPLAVQKFPLVTILGGELESVKCANWFPKRYPSLRKHGVVKVKAPPSASVIPLLAKRLLAVIDT